MSSAKPFEASDLEDLAGLRDELRVQSHLFKSELKYRWLEAEQRWHNLEDEIRVIAAHSRSELGAAASLTAEALRETYRELRQALHR